MLYLLHSSQAMGFEETVYSVLQEIRAGDETTAKSFLSAGRSSSVLQLVSQGLETTRNIYPALAHLQCLGELEQALPVICR